VRQNQRIAHELRLVTDRRTDRPAVTAYAALAQRRACEKNHEADIIVVIVVERNRRVEYGIRGVLPRPEWQLPISTV